MVTVVTPTFSRVCCHFFLRHFWELYLMFGEGSHFYFFVYFLHVYQSHCYGLTTGYYYLVNNLILNSLILINLASILYVHCTYYMSILYIMYPLYILYLHSIYYVSILYYTFIHFLSDYILLLLLCLELFLLLFQLFLLT